MNNPIEIFTNYPLWCAAIGWVFAQLMKTVVFIIQNKRFSFVSLTASGGMPSSHSATVCALATSVGLIEGFASTQFAIAFILAFIVMYDAAGVRRAAGEQAKILNRMMISLEKGKTEDMPAQLKELIGHTPKQVFVGGALGILIAVIMRYYFQ